MALRRRTMVRAAMAVAGLAIGCLFLWNLIMPSIKVGDQAPRFQAIDQQGQPFGLADYLGKKSVVLYFYPRDYTPACTAQACSFRDAYEQFLDLGAEVIGVSVNSSDSHRDFATSHRLPFKLISDGDGALRKSFGVPKTLGILPGRVTYIIDQKGIVRQIFNSQLQVERHIQDALTMVKQLAKERDAESTTPQ